MDFPHGDTFDRRRVALESEGKMAIDVGLSDSSTATSATGAIQLGNISVDGSTVYGAKWWQIILPPVLLLILIAAVWFWKKRARKK